MMFFCTMNSLSFIAFINLFIITINGTMGIMDGNPAQRNVFKYQVTILTWFRQHICGGGIIDETHILTAAHCVHDKMPQELWIGAGKVDLDDPEMVFKAVTEIHIHELYVDGFTICDNSTHLQWEVNDIAVLTISSPFLWSDEIGRLALPKTDVAVCDVGTFAGWGEDEPGSDYSMSLQWTYQRILDSDNCHRALYCHGVDQFCAITPPGYSGLSYGDDGGPLVKDGVVVGIADLVFVGDSDFQRFANVYYYRDFIASIIHSNSLQ